MVLPVQLRHTGPLMLEEQFKLCPLQVALHVKHTPPFDALPKKLSKHSLQDTPLVFPVQLSHKPTPALHEL